MSITDRTRTTFDQLWTEDRDYSIAEVRDMFVTAHEWGYSDAVSQEPSNAEILAGAVAAYTAWRESSPDNKMAPPWHQLHQDARTERFNQSRAGLMAAWEVRNGARPTSSAVLPVTR